MKFYKILFYSLVLSISLTIASPINIINANKGDFQIVNSDLFLINLFSHFSLFLIFLLILLTVLSIFFKNIYKLYFCVIVSILIWNLYLPLPIGKVDGIDVISISYFNVITGIFLGVIAFFFYKKDTFILFVIIIGPVTTALFSFPENINIEKNQSNSVLGVSQKEKNIFVISFDGAQSKYVLDIIESDEILKQYFQGFIGYKEVNAVAPYTHLSLSVTKLGYLPERNKHEELENYNLENYNKDFITTKLKDNGYKVETYGVFDIGESPNTKTIPQFNIKPRNSDIYYEKALGASLLRIFPFENKISKLTKLSSNIFQKDKMQLQINKHHHALAYYKKDIDDYQYFVESLDSNESAPTVRLHHYLFTHDPIAFSKECVFQIMDNSSQRKNITNETTCTVKKMIGLIEHLKALDVYDNSLIIFTSDHGYECFLHDENESDAYRVNQRWCLSRYKPFLLAKDFNNNNSFSVNETQRSLIDIPKTICISTLQNKQCDKYIGLNLFDTKTINDLEYRPILVGKGPEDVRSYHYFNKLNIERSTTLESFFEVKKYLPGAQDIICNKIVDFSLISDRKYYLSEGLTEEEHWGRWSNGREVYVKFKLQKNECNASNIVFNLKGFITKKNPVQSSTVFLNGETIGKIIIKAGEKNPRVFKLDTPTSLIKTDETNTLMFQIDYPTSPKEAGISNDSRLLGLGFQSMIFQ